MQKLKYVAMLFVLSMFLVVASGPSTAALASPEAAAPN
jgi:hypothetical protein